MPGVYWRAVGGVGCKTCARVCPVNNICYFAHRARRVAGSPVPDGHPQQHAQVHELPDVVGVVVQDPGGLLQQASVAVRPQRSVQVVLRVPDHALQGLQVPAEAAHRLLPVRGVLRPVRLGPVA
jgi:Fe-S-cluster-containing hydrogenase component 2